MLGGDDATAASQASERFRDRAVPQFWDGERLAGKEVSRSIGEQTRVAWDVYLFYRADAEWTEAGIPPPDAALAQVGLRDGGGVVATPGTLPARGDQSRLPSFLEGRAVIVGDNAELPALLAEVAAGYARSAGPAEAQPAAAPAPP